jgi:hypothetical protein
VSPLGAPRVIGVLSAPIEALVAGSGRMSTAADLGLCRPLPAESPLSAPC